MLQDCRATEWKDVRLTFDQWDLVHQLAGGESLDDYYLNGYGVEGLAMAMMSSAGMDVESDTIHNNSEGDTCNIHFTQLETAVTAAAAAAGLMTRREKLAAAVALACELGFED